jgi:hypothetical protein
VKHCSKCGRDYSDESLNFCLDDGTVLSRSNDPQATLRFAPPSPTDPAPTEVLRPQPSVPPASRSSQPWSLYLIIGLVVVVIGTVAVAVIVWAATNSTTSSNSNHDFATASPTYSSEPSLSPVINLNGRWRDVYGGTSEIKQTGESFLMTSSGTSCRGKFVASATGTISGTRIDLVYESNYSRGQCTGSVSSDGTHANFTCTDSVCGQFQTASERVR